MSGGKRGGPPQRRGKTVKVRSRRGRSASSARWLNRQLNDPYVEEAQRKGYRSRAAFKLIEIDDKFRFLKPGALVVDLGAAPGGWTQVAVERAGRGNVLALDLLEMEAIAGATIVQADFMEPEAEEVLDRELDRKADVILSDIAPPTTGHANTDHLRIMAVAEAVVDFAESALAEGGTLVIKVFQGGTERTLLQKLQQLFDSVKHVKPPASRKESSELYVVATGFRPSAG